MMAEYMGSGIRVDRGDAVRWYDWLQGTYRDDGEIVRCAKDGSWVDVRYPSPSTLFPEITHHTRRVRITKVKLLRKAASSEWRT